MEAILLIGVVILILHDHDKWVSKKQNELYENHYD